MEKYTIFNKRNLITAGLAAITLLIPGCQTLQPRNYNPIDYDQLGVYVDNNERDHSAKVESLQGKNTPVYPTIGNINF